MTSAILLYICRAETPDIRTPPFPGHDANWDVRSRKRLEHLVRNRTEHLTVGTKGGQKSYIDLNRYLTGYAELLGCRGREGFGYGLQAAAYAREKGLWLIFIHSDAAEANGK